MPVRQRPSVLIAVVATLLMLITSGCGGSSSTSSSTVTPGSAAGGAVPATSPATPTAQSGDVVVENEPNSSASAQTDGPGPMTGPPIDPNATRFLYTGFDANGNTLFGPLVAERAASQLCANVPLDVTTITVEHQDAAGVKLDDAIIRGVNVVAGGTVTLRAFSTRLDANKWTARAPYDSSFSPFTHNVGISYGGTSPQRGTVLDDLHAMTVVDGFKMIHIYHLFKDDLTIDPTSEAVLEYAQANGIEIYLGTRNVVVTDLLQTAAGAAKYVDAVRPFLAAGVIKVIAPGNEVNDKHLANIDPETFTRAVRNLRAALSAAGFPATPISVSLQYGGLTSYPPGGATFQDSADARSMQPYIEAIRSVNARPFVFVNIHPFYTVQDVVSRFPSTASWFPMFGLFTSTVDPGSNDPKEAPYWSLTDLQFNTVLTAMRNAGINGVQLFLGESGWPSADGGEFATSANQASYLNGLINLWILPQARTMPTFLFEAFDEPEKGPGQGHWGLRTVDGTRKPGIALPAAAAKMRSVSARLSASDQPVTYVLKHEDKFANLNGWNIFTDNDPAGSPTNYSRSAITTLAGGGVKIAVTNKLDSPAEGDKPAKWTARSGRMSSNFRQKYGLFLFGARQIPKLHHLWPALWTVGPFVAGANDKWPKQGEIDVMETIQEVEDRPDFTSRVMTRTNGYPDANLYFASVPRDDSYEIKSFLTAEQWKQPHTFAVDWYPVFSGGVLVDVMYDFYLDVTVSADGKLVRTDGSTVAPVKLHSYSLKQITEAYNADPKRVGPTVPDWRTLDTEWGAQSFVLNICVGGAWQSNADNALIKNGTWQPPADGSAAMIVDYVRCYQRSQ